MLTGTLRKGDHGVGVGALQQLLIEAGIPATGEADTFGDATEAAVRDFQAKHQLQPDGIVGAKTLAALNGDTTSSGSPAIPSPDYSRMSALMASALAIADGEWRRGVREDAGNRNRSADVDRYLIGRNGDGGDLLCFATYAGPPTPTCGWCSGKGPTARCFGSPWCARFALWCIQGAAAGFATTDPTKGAGDLAGASKWIRWVTKTDKLVGAGSLEGEQPRAGDVAIISTPGHGHVMLCASVVGDKCSTREGNASNRVNAHWRDVASITAWVRVG